VRVLSFGSRAWSSQRRMQPQRTRQLHVLVVEFKMDYFQSMPVSNFRGLQKLETILPFCAHPSPLEPQEKNGMCIFGAASANLRALHALQRPEESSEESKSRRTATIPAYDHVKYSTADDLFDIPQCACQKEVPMSEVRRSLNHRRSDHEGGMLLNRAS